MRFLFGSDFSLFLCFLRKYSSKSISELQAIFLNSSASCTLELRTSFLSSSSSNAWATCQRRNMYFLNETRYDSQKQSFKGFRRNVTSCYTDDLSTCGIIMSHLKTATSKKLYLFVLRSLCPTTLHPVVISADLLQDPLNFILLSSRGQ